MHTGAAVGASAGGTRVAADKGWVRFERQIGTTGVTLDPELYVAFGISGAVQHLTGISSPEHVVAVNIDPACPMMSIRRPRRGRRRTCGARRAGRVARRDGKRGGARMIPAGPLGAGGAPMSAGGPLGAAGPR